jgi:hypothetical protein
MTLHIWLSAVILAVFIGCGGGGSSSGDASVSGSTVLEGAWESQETDATTTEVMEVVFNSNNFSLNVKNFTSQEASMLRNVTLTREINAKGTFSIGEDITADDGKSAAKIDFHYTSFTGTFYTQSEVDSANANSICGYNDWKVAQSKDVLGCDIIGVDKDEKDIFRIEANRLYTGVDTLSNNYPTAIDTDEYLIRKGTSTTSYSSSSTQQTSSISVAFSSEEIYYEMSSFSALSSAASNSSESDDQPDISGSKEIIIGNHVNEKAVASITDDNTKYSRYDSPTPQYCSSYGFNSLVLHKVESGVEWKVYSNASGVCSEVDGSGNVLVKGSLNVILYR